MKFKERKLARVLRQRGLSINEIYRRLGVGKGSVSVWVRDIELSPRQKQELSKRGVGKEVIERRRATRLQRENDRRQAITHAAEKEVPRLSAKDLFLIGTVLYWAEGGKSVRSLVRFSNSDPEMIKIALKYLRDICGVPTEKFRGHVHIHSHLAAARAERYWSSVSGIPHAQFFKTYQKPSKASLQKKDSLPFGTFDIYVCDTALFLKIQGWIRGISGRLGQG